MSKEKDAGFDESKYSAEKIARAKIILRASLSAHNTGNEGLLYVGVLEALSMSKSEALMVARAIDESVDFVKLLAERSNA